MRKVLSYLIVSFIFVNAVNAQIFRHFQNAEFDKIVFTNSPDKKIIRDREIEFEQYFKNEFLLFEEIKPITLPIVFNLLVSDKKQVSNEQILNQIIALNRAFGNEIKMPEDDYYKDYAVDTELRFCIPEFNENFIRVKKVPEGTIFSDFEEIKKSEKGLEAFNSDKFINIWVCDLGTKIIENQKFIVAGYSQLPLRGSKTDGIVINIDLFGKQSLNELYSEGYTLVHLLGVYLGIKPLTGFGPCEGDGVDDTPNINAETLICLPQTNIHYVSDGCYFNDRRMTRNFMDNIPDYCATMFTWGQKTRMHGYLGMKGPRYGLVDDIYKECVITQPSSINQGKDINNIIIYPNPSNNTINIESNIDNDTGQNHTYSVFNLMGQKIESGKLINDVTIDVRSWQSGYYIFVVKLTDGKIFKKKFEVIK